MTQRPQPDRPSRPLLRFFAWACVVAGAGVLVWLMVQYVLLILILSGAVNIDIPFRLCISGATVVLDSRIAVVAAIVLTIGAAILKSTR